jgi:diguanylate cyclase (GGDEF)-like protein
MTKQILIADDEPSVRQLLELVLTSQGLAVHSATNGDHFIRMAQDIIPDLALVDLMMPGVDGYEAIRQLRNDTRTAHIPVIILTARGTPNDVVQGFETGADDYIVKPFNIPELLARVNNQLRRAAQRSVYNPLTGLPGNVLLTEEIKHRIRRDDRFALLYVDLNNFKAFNDTYGFARGDRMIKLLASILTEIIEEDGEAYTFIGHIGGDDFAMLTALDRFDDICQRVIAKFDLQAKTLYDAVDLQRGYLQGVDRHGIQRYFPIISLSIGVVTNQQTQFSDYETAGRIAAEMKHFAKQHPGSFYAVDVRSNHALVSDDRRGQDVPMVLLISNDAHLMQQLHTSFSKEPCRVLAAPDVPAAHALLAHAFAPALIVADARLDDTLWELLATSQQQLPTTALALLSPDPADAERIQAFARQAFFRLPLDLPHFQERTRDLIKDEE